MGKRGPQKTPTQDLVNRGARRGIDRRNTEPPVVAEEPSCPSFLKGEARRCWNRRVRTLKLQRVLSENYREALAIYCQSWGEYYDVCREIDRRGGLLSFTTDEEVSDDGNVAEVQRAFASKDVKDLLQLRKQSYEIITKLGPQFGWSPTSKADVKKTAPAPVGGQTTDKPASKDETRRFSSAADFGIVG